MAHQQEVVATLRNTIKTGNVRRNARMDAIGRSGMHSATVEPHYMFPVFRYTEIPCHVELHFVSIVETSELHGPSWEALISTSP